MRTGYPLRLIIAVLGLAGTLGPAQADLFTPPKGCTAFLTVQSKSCEVIHHWTCNNAPEGDIWLVSVGRHGPNAVQHMDSEFRWLDSYSLQSNNSTRLITPDPDPNSLSELLASGHDTFDFSQANYENGRKTGIEHIRGHDRLIGTKVKIDGEPLLVTEFEIAITTDDGSIIRTTGNQYISERFRLFFQGRETENADGDIYQYDNSPVRFIEPGEPDFLDNTPQYGCNQIMTGLPDAPGVIAAGFAGETGFMPRLSANQTH
ncbi:MAG: hypothetical protein CSA68_04005 [Rhodobacterales bacterium]|nr:MAG: hypothetical protein CSA68_04005 [Rhodobacterales bacterium]